MNFIKRKRSLVVAGTLCLFLVLTGILLSSTQVLQRLDLVVYDVMLPALSQSISDEIVVVTIDDMSLDLLGRWPWTRQHHAHLLDILTASGARAVGFDILFLEKQLNNPRADTLFAQAIANNQRTVLVLAPAQQRDKDQISELIPMSEFAVHAAALAHVDVELDVDGLCRRVFLYGGIGDSRWPSLALAMLEVGGGTLPEFTRDQSLNQNNTEAWSRQHEIMIPYTTGIRPRFISYVDILNGRVSEAAIRDKYVLIGSTATGLGDVISTPASFSHERMSGVELNAQVLNGFLHDNNIIAIPQFQVMVISVFLILMNAIFVTLIPMHYGRMVTLVNSSLVLILSVFLLINWQLWFPPVVTLLLVALAWPLWNIWQLRIDRRFKQTLLKRLDYQTHHHFSTGLPNHRMLEDRLQAFSTSLTDEDSLGCLMIIHMDWHGASNIVTGIPTGEKIIKAVAERLKAAVLPESLIVHLSGDDFAVFSSASGDEKIVIKMAGKLLEDLKKPFNEQDGKYSSTPHIGMSILAHNKFDTTTLLRDAHTAAFKSRIDVTQSICLYSADVEQELQIRCQLERALITALEEEEFELYYQPQVDLYNGRITGVEALLRWHSSKLGWVSPDTFIPVAEHLGLISTIGQWVLKTACRQLHYWQLDGFGPLRMAINVSPLQFDVPDLSADIKNIVMRAGVNPEDLELEITESVLMHDLNNAISVMRKIKQQGIKLAIDDFGTGFSSLSGLRNFPLDRLKIDRSFTREVGLNKDATEITLAILAIGKRLGLQVIAEGVETEAQAEFMRKHGCHEFQGYLCSQPLPVAEITRLLKKNK